VSGESERDDRDDRADRTDRAVGGGRVVLVTGPSGAGKSRVCARLQAAHGWPVVRLDDFYKDGDDPTLPMVDLGGGTRLPDWDDAGSWDAGAAVAALEQLVQTGSVQVPTYDISTSRAVGSSTVTVRPGQLVLAEGIFAAEIAPVLAERGLLRGAWCVSHSRAENFARRLLRDLAERRKPPLVLVRRGIELARREPAILARAEALGAATIRPQDLEALLR